MHTLRGKNRSVGEAKYKEKSHRKKEIRRKAQWESYHCRMQLISLLNKLIRIEKAEYKAVSPKEQRNPSKLSYHCGKVMIRLLSTLSLLFT